MGCHAAPVELCFRQCRDDGGVFEGIVGSLAVEHHRAYVLHVGSVVCERTHHQELVTVHDILVFRVADRPLQLYGTGIGEQVVEAEVQRGDSQVLHFVHHLVVLYLIAQNGEAVGQHNVQLHVLVLLGGRHFDEACVGVLLERDAVDGFGSSVLVGIAAANPLHGLVAREGNLQYAQFVVRRARHHVVGIETHVAHWACPNGHHLIVQHLPVVAAQFHNQFALIHQRIQVVGYSSGISPVVAAPLVTKGSVVIAAKPEALKTLVFTILQTVGNGNVRIPVYNAYENSSMSIIHTHECTIEEAVCNGWLNRKCSVYKSTNDPAFDGGRNPTVADGYRFALKT